MDSKLILAAARGTLDGSKKKAEFFHRRQGYGGQGRLNSKAPVAEIPFVEQPGEIGQRVHNDGRDGALF